MVCDMYDSFYIGILILKHCFLDNTSRNIYCDILIKILNLLS